MSSPTAICQLPSAPRILVRGTNWLGDAVMTTPALLRLREKFPAAHITLLTPEKLADLWRHHPNIDSVITFTAGESLLSVALKLRSLNPKRFDELPEVLPGDTLARVFARVTNILSASAFDGRLGFDLALILPNSPRSALEVWLAGIPWRIGYARPWRNWFLTEAVPARAEAVKMRKRSVGEIKQLIRGTGFQPVPPLNAHQMHEYLHLAGALGANPEPLPPQLVVTPDEIEAVKKKFGLKEIERPIFGLNPGAEYGPAKRWPVEKFIAAARDIQRTNCCVADLRRQGRHGVDRPDCRRASRFPFPFSRFVRQNFPPRTDGAAKSLPRAAHQRFRPDARGRGARHAGRRPVRQHLAGTDRAGLAGQLAEPGVEIRRAVFAVFPARMSH
jgi:ADP-heptose:LPS heptosyltransferase